MKRVDIVKRGDAWVGESDDNEIVAEAPTKEEAIRLMADRAENAGEPVSVVIHKEDGTIEEERTYPRSADPTTSEG